MEIRASKAIPVVECGGHRFRRHLGPLATAADLLAPHEGFGALRLFDDVVLDANAHATFDAHDGLETVVYVVEGEVRVSRDGSEPIELGTGNAARIMGGRGTRYEARNATAKPVRFFVVAVVAPRAHAQAPITTATVPPGARGMMWLATPAGPRHVPGTLEVRSDVRLGVALFGPGYDTTFASVVDRGLFLASIRGQIEVASKFLYEGGDARVPLGPKSIRIQGVTDAVVAVIDAPMGFAQGF